MLFLNLKNLLELVMIPKQLVGMRFNRVKFKDKKAFEIGWQNKTYTYEEIKQFFPQENYGVLCGKELRVLDDDTEKKGLIKIFINNFGETFRVRNHLYFKFDNGNEKKIVFRNGQYHLGELQGEGTYVVGAGSTHPSGEIYDVRNDLEIKTISYDKFVEVFGEFIVGISQTENKIIKKFNENDDDFIKSIKKKWIKGNRESLALSVAGYLRKEKRLGLNNCLAIVKKICEDCGDEEINSRLTAVKETYNKDESEVKGYSGLVEKNISIASKVFTPEGQAKIFNDIQPLFYDKNGLWWLWNVELYKWEIVDEIDILNMISASTGQDVVTPKNRTLILNSLKQEGRKTIPRNIKPTWIQFKNIIYDIITGENFKATPEYFVTNPLPYEIGENDSTPMMDKIFEEWVGKDYVQTLYEILAFSILPDYPIHRLFCFIGSGLNGKSKFMELLRNFIGVTNCCTTELDTLLTSRFEITRLHRKLVCIMGETNFNEMQKTSILKKLTGGDLIGFEYKNKNPFDEMNYAKILIATNNLPTTTDKTIGFYRRWMIIDFPNQFSEAKDILLDIPEEEYNALSNKCCKIIKELLEKREFTNEGTIEERKEKYEAKSNFLAEFVKKFTIEDNTGYITKPDFFKKFAGWCKENRHREMAENSVGVSMKKLGVDSYRKYFDWLYDGKGGQLWCWSGIKWRD